ncbi:MAG: hypothetical protein AAGD13_19535 [Pseudomonadota bacterium]
MAAPYAALPVRRQATRARRTAMIPGCGIRAAIGRPGSVSTHRNSGATGGGRDALLAVRAYVRASGTAVVEAVGRGAAVQHVRAVILERRFGRKRVGGRLHVLDHRHAAIDGFEISVANRLFF